MAEVGWDGGTWGTSRASSPTTPPTPIWSPPPPCDEEDAKLGQSVHYLTETEELGPGAEAGAAAQERGWGGQGWVPTAMGQAGIGGTGVKHGGQETKLNENDFISWQNIKGSPLFSLPPGVPAPPVPLPALGPRAGLALRGFSLQPEWSRDSIEPQKALKELGANMVQDSRQEQHQSSG